MSIVIVLVGLIALVVVVTYFMDSGALSKSKKKDTFRSKDTIGKTNLGKTRKARSLEEIARERNLAEAGLIKPKMPTNRITRAAASTAADIQSSEPEVDNNDSD